MNDCGKDVNQKVTRKPACHHEPDMRKTQWSLKENVHGMVKPTVCVQQTNRDGRTEIRSPQKSDTQKRPNPRTRQPLEGSNSIKTNK